MEQIYSGAQNRTAIILAGGEGTRLRELTRKIAGFHVPKQFCPLVGEVPLLEQTRRRVSMSVNPERISVVLSRDHERFFAPLLAGVSKRNLIVQSQNRGTAPAILYSLLRVAQWAPRASVLLIPSDHHVSEEAELMNYVDRAFAAVEEGPGFAVLLGIAPDEAETAYGWIEPGPALSTGTKRSLFRVRRFWEKPSREIARELMAKGCLWNSFMIVGQVPALLGLFMLAMPELYVSFSRIRASLSTVFEHEVVSRLYESLPTSDFSRQVLESAAGSMIVMPVRDIGWSDLGEPHRVVKALTGLRHKWANA